MLCNFNQPFNLIKKVKLTIEATEDDCDTLIFKDHAFEIRSCFLVSLIVNFPLSSLKWAACKIQGHEIYADTVLSLDMGAIASKLFFHNPPRRI